jgi:predicted PurR-regulated permease PerM
VRRVPLIALFVLSLAGVAAVGFPLWRPLLLAASLAFTLSGWHDHLAKAWRGRRGLSAAVFTLGVVLIILVPFCVVAYYVVHQAIDLVDLVRRTLAAKGMAGLVEPLPEPLRRWLHERYQSSFVEPAALMTQVEGWMTSGGTRSAVAHFLGSASNFLLSLVMMLIATFYLLRDGHELVQWLEGAASPGARSEIDEILDAFRAASKSVVGANVVAGGVQAGAAAIGFVIAHLPSPLFVAVLTFLASFVPSLVTIFVTLPAVGFLVVLGRPWSALFLVAWMTAVVAFIDNWLRPHLMRGRAHMHGGLVLFSLVGGMMLLGGMGVIAGPLALVFFLTMSSILGRRGTRERAT